MMQTKQVSLLVIAVAAALSMATGTDADPFKENHWDYREMPQEQIDFFDKHIPPIVELRKAMGHAVALRELDYIWNLAEEELGSTRYLYRAIWFEAQAHSGKQDQEWGLALFEYLFNKEITNNPDRSNSPLLHPADYILCGNIMENCLHVGKAARAREYSLKIEESLQNDLHFDLTGASYTDQGPVFSFLDDARKRTFPIFHHDMNPSEADSTERDFFYYPTMYGITFVAGTAMRSGDWKKAAELSAWCIRYANEYLVDQELMKSEVNLMCSYEPHKRLSDLALLHGYPDQAARFLEAYIKLSEGYYKTQEWDLLRAKLDLAVVQIQTGELPANVLKLANEAAKEMSANWYYSRMENMRGYLNKARIHHALGEEDEAWEIINGLLEKTAADVNPQYWLHILDTAIDLALADGATRPELEGWLALALDNARLTGNKFKELPLYEKYARFLRVKGRYAEALRIQQEAVRLAKAMNLPKRQADNRAVMAAINRELESAQTAIADASGSPPDEQTPQTAGDVVTNAVPERHFVETQPSPHEYSAIDIQPRLSLTASLQGQASYGRFYVYNPSAVSQTGRLRLTGPIDQIQRQGERDLSVGSSAAFDDREWTRPIRLEAGTSCIVDLIGLPIEDGSGATVQCQWIPNGDEEAVVSGSWSYRTAETEERTAVIDAHELRNNPFYLIPINHMIQRLDIHEHQIVDFSVTASSPMRIESYDAFTGTLLAVDANGDGDFLDKGDMIAGDLNRNNWPDLVFDQGQRLSSLTMYVQPLEPLTDEMELTIRIRTAGQWKTDAIDVIKPFTGTE